MNILIITAHPSSRGFTHKIAGQYRRGAEEAGHKAEIFDLYKSEHRQDYLEFEDYNEPVDCPSRDFFQQKISQADELVFVHPLWWMSMPAIMKNFVDTNFTPGFAYRYKYVPILKGRPVGLLQGKTARVFITCDGSRWLYKMMFTPFKLNWKYFLLHLWGIRAKSLTIFDRMRWTGRKKREKRLEKVYLMGKRT